MKKLFLIPEILFVVVLIVLLGPLLILALFFAIFGFSLLAMDNYRTGREIQNTPIDKICAGREINADV